MLNHAMCPPQFTIKSLKHNLSGQKVWKAGLIARSDDTIEFLGVFDQEVRHSKLGLIEAGTVSHEYYWHDKWFNIFRFSRPDGIFQSYYCNVAMPPKVEGNTLEYIDLDIDVLVSPDLSFEVLDMDEFHEHSIAMAYPPEVIAKALEALGQLKEMIMTRQFPFDQVVQPIWN